MKIVLLTTPIGNIEDVSERLKKYLSKQGLFLVEDTRKFFKLLELLGLAREGKKVVVFNDHKQDQLSYYLDLIEEYDVGYVLSDAGSPILSDPAYPLVKAVIEREGLVESIPGVSSVTTALEVSGLAPIPFMFHGFLPRKSSDQQKYFLGLEEKVTHCFFESPKRLVETLKSLGSCFPESEIVVVRELTKKFEQHYRFLGREVSSSIDEITTKGEFVILINCHHQKDRHSESELTKMARSYLDRPTPKLLAKMIGHILDENVSTIYERLNK